jgi:hypothetical protein
MGHSAAGRIRSTKKSNDLIGIRTRDLPACSTVPQPTTLLFKMDLIQIRSESEKSIQLDSYKVLHQMGCCERYY